MTIDPLTPIATTTTDRLGAAAAWIDAHCAGLPEPDRVEVRTDQLRIEWGVVDTAVPWQTMVDIAARFRWAPWQRLPFGAGGGAIFVQQNGIRLRVWHKPVPASIEDATAEVALIS